MRLGRALPRASVWLKIAIASVAIAVGGALLASDVGRSQALAADAPTTAPLSAALIWNTPIISLDGAASSLNEFRGKPLILYFWATWCAPCQTGVPSYSALHAKYASEGLAVVGIAIDNADDVRAFVAKKRATNPTYYAGAPAIKLSKKLGNAIGAMPYTVFIKADGTILEATPGKTPDDKIEVLVKRLLAKT